VRKRGVLWRQRSGRKKLHKRFQALRYGGRQKGARRRRRKNLVPLCEIGLISSRNWLRPVASESIRRWWRVDRTM
jgi:hypothetical protein